MWISCDIVNFYVAVFWISGLWCIKVAIVVRIYDGNDATLLAFRGTLLDYFARDTIAVIGMGDNDNGPTIDLIVAKCSGVRVSIFVWVARVGKTNYSYFRKLGSFSIFSRKILCLFGGALIVSM